MTMPDLLGIVADDLTGGAAIAGEIARNRGPEVQVVRLGHCEPDSDVPAVVETTSRYIDADESAARVIAARNLLQGRGFGLLMKKIDSTLKGNVATELAAFASAAEGTLVIAPACPAVSLSLRGGWQYREDSRGRNVVEMLASVLDAAPALLPLEIVQRGRGAVADWLANEPAAVVLADSIDSADLHSVAAGARVQGVREFAGTYGLGAALAPSERGDSSASAPRIGGRMLVLAGSANSVTSAQIQQLIRGRADEIVMNVQALIDGDGGETVRVRAAAAATRQSIVVVHTAADATASSVAGRRRALGWSERDLAERLADPFLEALEAMPDAGVYFIGGETTGAICDRLGWHRFTVTDEVTDAVPLATEHSRQRPFVLTKPGAFGGPDDLCVAAERLIRRSDALR